jgi:hypothetical protein
MEINILLKVALHFETTGKRSRGHAREKWKDVHG